MVRSNLTFNVQVIEQESVKGFPEVVVGTNVSDCISHVIQVDVTSLPKDIFEYGEDFKIFGQSIQFLLVYSGHKLIQTKLSCSHEVCLFSRESFSSHKFCVLQLSDIHLNPLLNIPYHFICVNIMGTINTKNIISHDHRHQYYITRRRVLGA